MTVYGVTELSRFRTNGYVNWTRIFSHYSYAFALEAINHRSKGKLSKVLMQRAIFYDTMDLLVSRMTISK